MSTGADTTAITNLIASYAEAVDRGDFAAVGALFAEGSFSGVEGSAAVEEMFRGMIIVYEDGTPRTHHVTTNIAVEFGADGETATARSYFTVLQATAELPLQPVAAGRYRDRFVRRDGTWRFAERTVRMPLTGDLSRHIRGPVPGFRSEG